MTEKFLWLPTPVVCYSKRIFDEKTSVWIDEHKKHWLWLTTVEVVDSLPQWRHHHMQSDEFYPLAQSVELWPRIIMLLFITVLFATMSISSSTDLFGEYVNWLVLMHVPAAIVFSLSVASHYLIKKRFELLKETNPDIEPVALEIMLHEYRQYNNQMLFRTVVCVLTYLAVGYALAYM
jgi:hypothetical protein